MFKFIEKILRVSVGDVPLKTLHTKTGPFWKIVFRDKNFKFSYVKLIMLNYVKKCTFFDHEKFFQTHSCLVMSFVIKKKLIF